ncbi:hypothetical protein ACFV3R_27520 [Streptomyces sp. NPDC059740]|uniref:hypothetical protein n=1 Tax=Streptomyces sp. NPDC059740 TaxID=3346926 RepID=UPI003652C2B8
MTTPRTPAAKPPTNLASPANPARGWRIDRIPGKRVSADESGLHLPLWLLHDGRHKADVTLRMSYAEAEHLHAELCYTLSSDQAMDCRPCGPGGYGHGRHGGYGRT